MRKQTLILLSALLVTSMILSACGSANPTSAPVANDAVTQAPAAGGAIKAPAQAQLSGTISVSGAFALYPMMTVWADEFTKLHPDVQFDVQGGGAGKGITLARPFRGAPLTRPTPAGEDTGCGPPSPPTESVSQP